MNRRIMGLRKHEGENFRVNYPFKTHDNENIRKLQLILMKIMQNESSNKIYYIFSFDFGIIAMIIKLCWLWPWWWEIWAALITKTEPCVGDLKEYHVLKVHPHTDWQKNRRRVCMKTSKPQTHYMTRALHWVQTEGIVCSIRGAAMLPGKRGQCGCDTAPTVPIGWVGCGSRGRAQIETHHKSGWGRQGPART